MTGNNKLPALIQSMMTADGYPHTISDCQLIETHISWVILTGDFAYKIKKPVNLGFLDFSTLNKRCFYCKEEWRLNKRLAPDIYLEVVEITGTPEHPEINGKGKVIECAVKMLQFPQEVQLNHVLERGELQLKDIDSIALMVAHFHEHIEVANTSHHYGNPEHVWQPMLENFSQIREHLKHESPLESLAKLENWSESTYARLNNILLQRKRLGFIRECHGDLHLRNLAWYQGKPLAFDCLEFNPDLRWVDIISEVAFLTMDLEDHQQSQMAHRFINTYLENTGDYAGIQVLRFYLVYRAMVRAKVDAIRAGQANISQQEQQTALKNVNEYLQLAQYYTTHTTPKLIITRGLSASGKTTKTQALLELLGAIRIRSDVERKRLFNLKPEQDAGNAIGEGIYTAAATERTYKKLAEFAELISASGYTVIIDAANLENEKRQLFQQLAKRIQVPYIILEFTASPEILRQRIIARQHDASDADVNILEHQLKHYQPLSEHEQSFAISIDTELPLDVIALQNSIETISRKQTKY